MKVSSCLQFKPALFIISLLCAGCATDEATGLAMSDPKFSAEQVAQAAYSIGDYQDAVQMYERASARNPTSAPAFIGLGKSYAALGQKERAQSALQAALTLDPRNALIHTEFGSLALAHSQAEQALKHFTTALSFDRTNLVALTGLGIAYDSLSQHDQAQVNYQKALQRYPTNFALLNNYGLSQALSGKAGHGIPLLAELVNDPQNGELARENLAIAYALAGRDQDARVLLKALCLPKNLRRHLRFIKKRVRNNKQVAQSPCFFSNS